MISRLEAKKQKGFLQIAFMIVFAISFILVIFENVKINNNYNDSPVENNITSIVHGKSINRKAEISEYSTIIEESLIIINSNIDLILQDKIISSAQMNQVYDNLLLANVPTIFQELHFSLIRITKEILKSENADKNYLKEQKNSIFKKYPWLFEVIQK